MRDLLISNQISLPSCLLSQQKFKGVRDLSVTDSIARPGEYFNLLSTWIGHKENSIQSCKRCLVFRSLDHLIHSRQHGWRNRQADLLGGL